MLDTTNKLTVRVVTADSGKPIPSVEFDYWIWGDGEKIHRKALHADRFGVCEVPVPRSKVTTLILVSERDGFADTRLQWHTDQGEVVPQEYTLRLVRATAIGGTVVDADGKPVAGAKIGFNNRTDPSTVKNLGSELLTETSDFGWPFWIETKTDSAGHWQINRIGKEALETLQGGADHPSYLPAREVDPNSLETIKQLVAGTYVFHLGRAVEVYGKVTDLAGAPILGARVRVGYAAFEGTRHTKTGPTGDFSVGGCKLEKTPITADMKGFAATTIEADLTTKLGPYHLTLLPGKVVRLQVVDAKGDGISNVWVALDNMPRWNGTKAEAPAVQADFAKRTDADGRLEWDEAPDSDLKFTVQAGGYLRGNIHFRPDGNEHTIALSAGLTLFGSVTDAATGQPLPAFRIIVGWPTTNSLTGEVGARWSTIDRFWLKFSGGTYRHLFDEPALGGPDPGFVFKFEADGYTPLVTRIFGSGEGEVRLDAAMQQAVVTRIAVLLPDGQPASKADVGFVTTGARLKLLPGGLSQNGLDSAEGLIATDDTGHFSLTEDKAVKSIVIAHPEGFIETTSAALAAEPTVQLQPWSRIEGTLLYDGQPATGREIQLQFDNKDFQAFAPDSEKFRTTSDAGGKFVFPQVPPGKDKLVLIVPFDGGPGMKGTSGRPLTNLDIAPGATVSVTTTTTVAPGTVIRFPARISAAQPAGQ